ncbi:DUF2946 family protein [Croceibacterium aestuarii]|uniref:DUF2946 family protein n=1 Tax=Croceibacterium aestuarii TaxID=3064139 RepID=UPI00272ED92E|nr:DUF2946 family protein [Croceibacterium sp. D39]
MRESLPVRAKRGFALMLLLAALLVRAAIPQGYMAESTAPGTLAITICHSGMAPPALSEMHVDQHGRMNHDRMGHDKKGHGEPQPCAFAVAGHATPPPEIPFLPLSRVVAEAFTRSEAPFALASATRQLPPARAPPAIA